MPRRSIISLASVLSLLLGGVMGQSASDGTVGIAGPALSGENDWSFEPDPPSTDQDLTITYDGPDETVSYEIDGQASVDVDTSSGTFRIPKSKLSGKRFVKLKASGGEAGYLIIRFP
ncbi:MAG: hypothetical protein KDC95_16685 [Planctomycetes bacterium]|nr:hypothetical protein [Planctomycetota bacterium]